MNAQLPLFLDTKPGEKGRVGQLLIIRFFTSSSRNATQVLLFNLLLTNLTKHYGL